MKKETIDKYIGKTIGVLTILEIDKETYNKDTKTKRTWFKCRCNRCGENTCVRSDRFYNKEKYYPKSCTNCIKSLQKEIAEEKYKIKSTKWLRGRINSIKSNAKTRKIEVELTELEIENLINKNCYYCGEEFAKGIDRVDSEKSYKATNCVPCCYMCNRMKNKYSKKSFFEKVEKIYKIHIEGSTTISKESTLQVNGSGNRESLSAAA